MARLVDFGQESLDVVEERLGFGVLRRPAVEPDVSAVAVIVERGGLPERGGTCRAFSKRKLIDGAHGGKVAEYMFDETVARRAIRIRASRMRGASSAWAAQVRILERA